MLYRLLAPIVSTAFFLITNSPGCNIAGTVSLLPLPGTTPPLAKAIILPPLFLVVGPPNGLVAISSVSLLTLVVKEPTDSLRVVKAVVFDLIASETTASTSAPLLFVVPVTSSPNVVPTALLPPPFLNEDAKPDPKLTAACPNFNVPKIAKAGSIGLKTPANLINPLVI